MDIERISVIKRSDLNEEFYFQSLLEQAYGFQMILDTDIERLQYECLELLEDKVSEYNSGSSSVRVEVAQSIMASNLYTIGIWLKTYPCADDAVKALSEMRIYEIYAKGRKRIDKMLDAARVLHSVILDNLLETSNYYYNATVVDGIKGFFKIYNPEFEAQEIHITADYPIHQAINNLAGIEFIQKYLEAIYFENLFCRNYTPDDIHHMLCGCGENYKDLLFNIYEPVLAAAIGCVICGIGAGQLAMPKSAIIYLQNIFTEKPIDEINLIIAKAFDELKNEFFITGSLEQYVRTSLQSIAVGVHSSVKLRTLDNIFIIR